jgi:hypothetical protein
MSHKLSFAALALAFICVTASAADKIDVVGKWEGKSGKGKVVVLELKEDKSLVMSEDGKVEEMPGVTMKWDLVDAEKGFLDFIMVADGKEMRVQMLAEMKDGKLKIGGPKEMDKRPATMADSDDPVEFTKK